MEEYVKYWENYVNFSGRATRREFWLPVLFNIVISMILSKLNTTCGTIFSLVTFIPNLAIDIRRFHDINKSGWNVLWALLPIVGWIILLVNYCKPTVEDENKYATDEKIEDIIIEETSTNNNPVEDVVSNDKVIIEDDNTPEE